MKKHIILWCLLMGVLAIEPVSAANHSYQVTGPVTAVTATSISVQKGSEVWEINRDANTKVTGDVKVGSKITIQYYMTATAADVKVDKPAAKAKK